MGNIINIKSMKNYNKTSLAVLLALGVIVST